MRIVLAADGTRGDVYPLLALGARLRRRGHAVRLCAPPNFQAAVEAQDLDFSAVGLDTQAFLVERARAVTRGGLEIMREVKAFAHESLEEQLRHTPELARGADLLVAAGVQLGARVAAEIHGIPYRYVAYCPGLIPSPSLTPIILPTRPLPRWLNRLAWRATRRLFDLLVLRAVNERLARDGAGPVRDAIDFVLGDRPLLAADVELAPAPSDCAVPVEQIRCLHPFGGDPLPEKLENFLDAGPPPVYVGFGSMTDPDPAATTRVLLEAIRAAGVRAVISKGWAGLAEGALPADVFAADPVSHAHLFPRVAAVIHHGGAGTTTTAARAGVPQIVIPHVLDQHYWCARVTGLGLGPPPIRRSRLAVTPLCDALRSMEDNEVLRDRAREMGERLRANAAAAPDPAEVLLRN